MSMWSSRLWFGECLVLLLIKANSARWCDVQKRLLEAGRRWLTYTRNTRYPDIHQPCERNLEPAKNTLCLIYKLLPKLYGWPIVDHDYDKWSAVTMFRVVRVSRAPMSSTRAPPFAPTRMLSTIPNDTPGQPRPSHITTLIMASPRGAVDPPSRIIKTEPLASWFRAGSVAYN
ncbi:hypothetical protein T440DRAFT_263159 [Plenodomus tracheiphilus IPT5]|uniref:Secreted protein n=1 Tax=Plenodomus tracheiphilus IPT5 TaxID=1408161 RepID=A0A6A7AS19_9PLEO|nr:hypothetical protein T440DRAFT_263159 [Plenodomus tracheiphilus IPT5]